MGVDGEEAKPFVTGVERQSQARAERAGRLVVVEVAEGHRTDALTVGWAGDSLTAGLALGQSQGSDAHAAVGPGDVNDGAVNALDGGGSLERALHHLVEIGETCRARRAYAPECWSRVRGRSHP